MIDFSKNHYHFIRELILTKDTLFHYIFSCTLSTSMYGSWWVRIGPLQSLLAVPVTVLTDKARCVCHKRQLQCPIFHIHNISHSCKHFTFESTGVSKDSLFSIGFTRRNYLWYYMTYTFFLTIKPNNINISYLFTKVPALLGVLDCQPDSQVFEPQL